MATTMVNGNPTTENPSTILPSAGKQQPKATAGSKLAENNRKQANNAGDGVQRRNAPPKAWTTGMNPITQRSNTPGQANGTEAPSKTNISKVAVTQDANSKEKLHSDLMWSRLGNSMGHKARVILRNGETFSGIFFGASVDKHESAYLLKMVQHSKPVGGSELNGTEENRRGFVGMGREHVMTFDSKDVVEISVEGLSSNALEKQQNGLAGFRTDADISGNLALRERQLQRWTSSADTNTDLSLEESGSGEAWDQFKANEQLFGLKTDYDENIYTTSIDRSNPSYREREARAQRLAREIEGTAATNSHIREERGIVDEDGGFDEEEKYSGVRRHGAGADYPPLQSSQANRYMPPARRPPSGKPTVAGAPVDPAIISSQISHQDNSPQGPNAPNPTPLKNNGAASSHRDPNVPEVEREPTKENPSPAAAVSNGSRPSEGPETQTPTPTTAPAPANVETQVRNAFQKFAHTEKNRVAEDRRKRAMHDKTIKLNDLKKFSTNFKLHTPVPKDLVPILAKDVAKQHEIVEKAQREADQKSVTPPKPRADSRDPTPSRPSNEPRHEGTRAANSTITGERQEFSHSRQGIPPRGPQAGMSPRDKQQQFSNMFSGSPQSGQGMLGHRMGDNHGRHKAGMHVSVPTPLPIHSAQKPASRPSINAAPVSSSQASSTVRTPTSAASAKFNANAIEFRPNPAANTFKPTGNSGSTSSPVPLSRAPSPTEFFGSRKPLSPDEKPSILDNFNPLKRLKEKASKENKTKDYAANGGIVHAYSTPPTWSKIDDTEKQKSYKDMYEDIPQTSEASSPQQPAVSPVNPALLHQLPPHLQHGPPQAGPPSQGSQQQPFQGPPPYPYHGGPAHFDEQRVHPSPSGSSAFPTPRIGPTYVPYAQPIQYPQGQPIGSYAMGPGSSQPSNFRQVHGAPPYAHSPGQQFSAPMMMQSSSQGGAYMGQPPMQGPPMAVFPPVQGPPYGGHSQPPSNYPSPGRGPPMMINQNPYQGQNPQVYVNNPHFGPPVYAQQPPQTTPMRSFASPHPNYSHSPQQQVHYPPQVSRVPSNSYGHHQQAQYPRMQVQHAPPSMDGGEAMK